MLFNRITFSFIAFLFITLMMTSAIDGWTVWIPAILAVTVGILIRFALES